mmetsp:Transcript_940/g.1588  ORF Transcript_940/g.1588 Transcript_940/m.1588 type:complete len:291 (+) Transcript_940:47-919(+)|eukprot:CAMPEP_0119312644 /NCGR_PEP_ID=MMETSP1333-20130426/26928_1 /TAXON_ID=418940 /ORGANISM="Scyphosphaera apsteinii, Strain RCC1455" /LENGTH=290 /DNA_ID=CAMNT_0007317297 /DNA_START=41 /DNA_END=913 /DNA_ORIENTATION=+
MPHINGFLWLSHVTEEELETLRSQRLRADDVIVASFPKSGTHWVHRLCSLILGVPQQMHPTAPRWLLFGAQDEVDGPRILATHCPWSMLPRIVHEEREQRLVYVVRNVKDTLVSNWFFSRSNPYVDKFCNDNLDGYIDWFCGGTRLDPRMCTRQLFGGYASHVNAYVDAALGGAKMHIVSYDRLHTQPQEELRLLACFLNGKNLTNDELSAILAAASFHTMLATALHEDVTFSSTSRCEKKRPYDPANTLFRRGVPDDSKTVLSAAQAKRIDEAFKESLAPLHEQGVFRY